MQSLKTEIACCSKVSVQHSPQLLMVDADRYTEVWGTAFMHINDCANHTSHVESRPQLRTVVVKRSTLSLVASVSMALLSVFTVLKNAVMANLIAMAVLVCMLVAASTFLVDTE
jgi:hypothetical protein